MFGSCANRQATARHRRQILAAMSKRTAEHRQQLLERREVLVLDGGGQCGFHE